MLLDHFCRTISAPSPGLHVSLTSLLQPGLGLFSHGWQESKREEASPREGKQGQMNILTNLGLYQVCYYPTGQSRSLLESATQSRGYSKV